jgi:hypothetical protein
MLLLLAFIRALDAGLNPRRRIALPGLMAHTRPKLVSFVLDNSLLLVAGTIAAVVWANLDLTSYEHVAHPLHFWVNDVGMVCFLCTRGNTFAQHLPPTPADRIDKGQGVHESLPDLE